MYFIREGQTVHTNTDLNGSFSDGAFNTVLAGVAFPRVVTEIMVLLYLIMLYECTDGGRGQRQMMFLRRGFTGQARRGHDST